MEIFSLRALWKGLRGRSLTFSLVFAMAVMGGSFAGLLRAPLRTIGLWAPLLFILPIVATALLSKYERKLPIEAKFRQYCSYGLVLGAILFALLLWRYEGWLRTSYADSFQPGPLYKEQPELIKRRGPRGK